MLRTWPQGWNNLVVLGSFSAPIIPKKGEKTMENSNFERFKAALELMRFKALSDIAGDTLPLLDIKDVNEILLVAGLPVIVPDEVNKKELEVI